MALFTNGTFVLYIQLNALLPKGAAHGLLTGLNWKAFQPGTGQCKLVQNLFRMLTNNHQAERYPDRMEYAATLSLYDPGGKLLL